MLPRDPIILLSFVNTQLRDGVSSLEELCAQHGASPEEVKDTLAQAGFLYDPAQNRFR